jgi:hypothetical protein
MNCTFRVKFVHRESGKVISLKFQRNTMSDSSVYALAKLALGDKTGEVHDHYKIESITEV